MSSTRQTTDGSFHQEKFCSSPEFERGLMANIVAKRCELLANPNDRELVWYVQHVSHNAGLDVLAAELIRLNPARIGTPSMRRYGMEPGRRYTAEEVREVRTEIPCGLQRFPLAGELCPVDRVYEMTGERTRAQRPDYPDTYGVERFLNLELLGKETLPQLLARLCSDPACDVQSCSPWYFKELVPALREHMRNSAEAGARRLVPTRLAEEVCRNLDFVLATGGMHVMEGPAARIGKTYAARTWCGARLGRARYLDVPASNDDITFFRRIAEAIGSASALSFKGVQLRERVETSLRSSKLMLVLDNAHYLWPQSNRREALPNRLNWLLSALVNHGVPVALLTTPQFLKDQLIVARKTGWTSAQFLNNIGEYSRLPGDLSVEELQALGRSMLPAGDEQCLKALALCAKSSNRQLATIEAVVRRAQYLAKSSGRAAVEIGDVKQAISAYVLPSDDAMASAMSGGVAICVSKPYETPARAKSIGKKRCLVPKSRLEAALS